ncbi:MAG: RodZ domain-containing protein [Acidobacteriota bacterium]
MTDFPALAFGEELRRERQIREISIEEISSATKISIRLLTALEEGNLERLPAPAFTRGFIRAYALHLGIDPEEKVNAYLADLAGGPREAASPKKARPRSRFFRGRRGSASLMVGGVAAILLVLGFIASPQRHDRSAAPTVVAPRSEPVAFKNVGVSNEATPFIQNRMDHAAANTPATPVAGEAEPVALENAPVAARGITLTLEFAEDSWAKVDADGKTILNGMVHRGETRRLQAQDGFRLTLGNAGGVRVSVDGRALEPLGVAGEVVRDLPLPAASSRG